MENSIKRMFFCIETFPNYIYKFITYTIIYKIGTAIVGRGVLKEGKKLGSPKRKNCPHTSAIKIYKGRRSSLQFHAL